MRNVVPRGKKRGMNSPTQTQNSTQTTPTNYKTPKKEGWVGGDLINVRIVTEEPSGAFATRLGLVGWISQLQS